MYEANSNFVNVFKFKVFFLTTLFQIFLANGQLDKSTNLTGSPFFTPSETERLF